MPRTTFERTIVLDGLAFAEGPRWHNGRLYVSDMHSHHILAVTSAGNREVVGAYDGRLSGLGWLPDGQLLAVAMDGWLLRNTPGGFVGHADLRDRAPYGVNDMVVDSRGRAYVGQFGYDYFAGETSRPSALLLVRPDGTVHEAAQGLSVANGMAITADGGTLVVAESGGKRLTAFDICEDGSLSDRRIFAELNDIPDGMCLDSEGAAWVACPVGRRFVRVLPGGEVTDVLDVERDRHAIACVLGDDDRRTLYLVTAATLGNAELSLALRSSRIERVRVDVPGYTHP